MGISANCNLVTICNIMLDHGGFLLDNVHDSDDDLVDVFLSQLLSVLEPLNHVFDKLQSHLISQLCAIVCGVHSHVFEV